MLFASFVYCGKRGIGKGLVRVRFSFMGQSMAKTAAALSSIPAATHTASAREQESGAAKQGGFRTASIEERTAVLETRWEETVPTLATSKDISDLRGEMRNLENRLLRWGVGAGIALLAVFATIFIANTARMDALDAKLETSVGKLDAKLDASVGKLSDRMDRLDARMDRLDAKLDARFEALMARQDALDAKLDARFDALVAELRELRK